MTAIYHPQTMDSERLLNAYKQAGVTPPTKEQERHLADLWREIAMKTGTTYMPNAESEPDMWIHHMGKRLAGYMKKVGIQNDFVINQIRDATLNRTRTNGMIGNEDYPFDILKSALLNREEMKAYMATKMKQHDPLPAGTLANAKPSNLVPAVMKNEIVERAQKLDDALDTILREMDYKDSDLTLRRNVYRPYGGVVATKVVQAPNYVQLEVETAFREEIARMQNGPEKVSELDEYFPRGKADESVSPDEAPADATEGEAIAKLADAEKEDTRDFGPFYETVKNLGYTREDAHKHFNVASMKEALGSVALLTMQFRKANPPKNVEPENPATENAVQNTPQSNEKPSNFNETKPTGDTTNAIVETPNKSVSQNGTEKAVSVPSVFAPVPMLPDMSRWEIMRQQAGVLIKSGFLPQSIRTAEQCLTIMMMGDALGVQPIVALNNINVIQGKPTVSPQLQLALIRRSGQLEAFQVTDDGETCKVIIKRRGEAEHVETFSQKDAAAMGLSNKDNWKKQPATMRRWRAISAACRLVFSDIVWGIASYTTEEIDPDFTIEAA